MASSLLEARSAFQTPIDVATAAFSVRERADLAIASVAARKGTREAVAAGIQKAYGLELPVKAQRVASDRIAFVWNGPDQWLAVAQRGQDRDLERELKSLLGPLASITDQSDARVVVTVSGLNVRDVLAKGLPIDLHPREFRSGSVAITHASHIGIVTWQTDDAPTYDICLFRSYASSFMHWLKDAAGEFH